MKWYYKLLEEYVGKYTEEEYNSMIFSNQREFLTIVYIKYPHFITILIIALGITAGILEVLFDGNHN